MGRSSQRKGAVGERELVAIFTDYGFPALRGGSETYGEIPDIIGLPAVHVEAKRVERLNISEAMRQSVRDAERFKDGMPTVFHRRNREKWLVTMRLSDWMQIYKKFVGGKEDD